MYVEGKSGDAERLFAARPAMLDAISAEFQRLPRHIPIRAAKLTDESPLAGARGNAFRSLRSAVVALPRQGAIR